MRSTICLTILFSTGQIYQIVNQFHSPPPDVSTPEPFVVLFRSKSWISRFATSYYYRTSFHHFPEWSSVSPILFHPLSRFVPSFYWSTASRCFSIEETCKEFRNLLNPSRLEISLFWGSVIWAGEENKVDNPLFSLRIWKGSIVFQLPVLHSNFRMSSVFSPLETSRNFFL